MLISMLILAAAAAPAAPAVVQPTRARAGLVSLFSDADYPASAVANREEGRVGFRLDVGADGRVGGCAITRSSGSSALDSTTCRLLMSRARFAPARDSTGTPTADTVAGHISWKLPPAPPPAGD